MRNVIMVGLGLVALAVTAGRAGAATPVAVPSSALVSAVTVADDDKGKADKRKAKKDDDDDDRKGKGEKGKGKQDDDDKRDVKLPKAVAEAVKSTFPGARVVKAEKEDEDGEAVYELTLKYKAGTLEATLTPKGRVVKVELKGHEDDEKGKNKKGDDEDDDKKGKGKKDDDRAASKDKSSGSRGEQTGEHRDGEKKERGKDDDDKGDKGKGKKKGDRD